MDYAKIKETIALLIIDTFPELEDYENYKELLINDNTKLADDLQMDSFSIIALQVSIEEAFGFCFDPLEDDFVTIFCTIGSLSKYVFSKTEV